jgi:hypothetical protein
MMHGARKWVYWWHTLLNCALLTLTQVAGVWWLDLSTTVGIFKFSFLTAGVELFVHVVGGLYGYWDEGRRERRAAGEKVPDAQELLVP